MPNQNCTGILPHTLPPSQCGSQSRDPQISGPVWLQVRCGIIPKVHQPLNKKKKKMQYIYTMKFCTPINNEMIKFAEKYIEFGVSVFNVFLLILWEFHTCIQCILVISSFQLFEDHSLLTPWVLLVLLLCGCVCGHPLEHGQPTRDHTP